MAKKIRSTVNDIIKLPEIFDARVSACNSENDHLELLFLLQSFPERTKTPSAERAARMAWVMLRLGQVNEAIDLLKAYPKSLLAQGYLARVMTHFYRTEKEIKSHLGKLDKLSVKGSGRMSDLEGTVHLLIARAMHRITLREYPAALKHLQEAESAARVIKIPSVLAVARYEIGRIHYQQKDYLQAITALVDALQHVGRTQTLHTYAGDLLFWSCLVGGLDFPEGTPAWVREAYPSLMTGSGLADNLSPELSHAVKAMHALRVMTDYYHREYPGKKGKLHAKKFDMLFQNVLSIEVESWMNEISQMFIGFARALACSMMRDERECDEWQTVVKNSKASPIQNLIRCFGEIQLCINAGGFEMQMELLNEIIENWQKCSMQQKIFLSQMAWTHMPYVPFALEGTVGFQMSPQKIATVSPDGIFYQGDRLVDKGRSYPADQILQAAGIVDTDLELDRLGDHAFFMRHFRLDRFVVTGIVENAKKHVLRIKMGLNHASDIGYGES